MKNNCIKDDGGSGESNIEMQERRQTNLPRINIDLIFQFHSQPFAHSDTMNEMEFNWICHRHSSRPWFVKLRPANFTFLYLYLSSRTLEKFSTSLSESSEVWSIEKN